MRQLYSRRARIVTLASVAGLWGVPSLALAQASPFLTGATSLQTNILAWLTPIAIILVMALGAMAMANRLRSERTQPSATTRTCIQPIEPTAR